ncbi:hypothetical protein TNCV_287321 [Trichonephila clavipes]|nr:hypothetical protein TNCV_287321 [Trichonephila clavipes]
MYIITKLARLCQRKHARLQWIPSNVDVFENEAAHELVGWGCDLPNPSSSVASHSEIHSLHRARMNLTWRNPPSHHCYAVKSLDLSLQRRSSRALRTALGCFSGPAGAVVFKLFQLTELPELVGSFVEPLELQSVFVKPHSIPIAVLPDRTGNTGTSFEKIDFFFGKIAKKVILVPKENMELHDEAHFWLNGYVNKQNCRTWSEANPQVYVETPLHPEKLTVWCALWAGGILLQKR